MHVLVMNLTSTLLSTESVEHLQEVIITNYLIKTCSEQVHKAYQLTRLNALGTLEQNVHKVSLFDHSSPLLVKCSEPSLQIHFHLIDAPQYRDSFCILHNDLFFKNSRILLSERVLFVAPKGWTAKIMLSCAHSFLWRIFISEEHKLARNI
jgi:hypothetical protein